MRNINQGIVYTNENCIGCNKCISRCPIPGANVSIIKDGKSCVNVDSRKCTHCGLCIKGCNHDARKYLDDTDDFFKSLADGEKISLIVEPSFYLLYGKKAFSILGYLKHLGVDKIYDGAYGAEISMWAHLNYIKQHENDPVEKRAFFSQICPSIINSIETQYPEIIEKIIPVQSPLMCTAIYARKYLKDENKLALLSSCFSIKDEINSQKEIAEINFCLTYDHCLKMIGQTDLDSYTAESDLKTDGIGNIISFVGGMKDALSYFLPRSTFMVSFAGISINRIKEVYVNFVKSGCTEFPSLVELQSCQYGCNQGPGVPQEIIETAAFYQEIHRLHKNSLEDYLSGDWKQNTETLNKKFQELKPEDFSHSFKNRYLQRFVVPEYVIDDTFNSMLKTTPQKRSVNCGSCGYKTCTAMANAVALGYNKKENCIQFMNEEMARRYQTTPLTGSLNREGFCYVANKCIKENPDKKYIIAVGNLNKCKIINGLYGQSIGDEVIRLVSAELKALFDEEIIFGQYSGFFALCFECRPENLARLRGVKSFDGRRFGIEMPITVRFGFVMADNPEVPVEEYHNNATMAMDLEVQPTRNTFSVYNDELKNKIFEDVSITNQMQAAIDNDEFILYFQPQYRIDGKLIGAESLCRWMKPDGTLIPPGKFIPVSEKNGFIRLLDKIIFEKAFATVRRWLDDGFDLVPISVNISRISLENDAIVYTLDRLRKQYNVPENLIHFEITESAFMSDQKALIERIQKIKDYGFSIALDDFGSGYSSLNALKDIPIDILKLDMGFLRENSNMERGGKIISSVVKMAQDLSLTTIAEGVETVEQLNYFKTIGCDIIQGFIFSQPLPAGEFKKLLKENRSAQVSEQINVNSKIDVRKLYDPNSGESIMFENFTGAAVVFEYENNELTLVRYNEKCMQIFGIKNKPFSEVASSFKKEVNSEFTKVFFPAVEKAINTNAESVCVTCHKKVDQQTPIWLKSHIWYMGMTGQRHMIYVNLEDITQSKLIESTLTIANSQMSLIMDNSLVGMCLMSVSVDFRHVMETVKIRVLKVNNQFVELSGFTEEEVMAWTEKDALSVIHPLDKPGFIFKMVKAFLAKKIEPLEYVYRARKRDGSYIWVRIMVVGIRQEDGSFITVSNYVKFDKDKDNKK